MVSTSTYEERQKYRDAHPGVVVDNSSSSDGGFHSDSPNGTPTSGGTTSGGGGGGGGGSSGGGGGAPSGSYQTVNGTQTIATMVQQLQNAGWGGNASDPASVVSAYASTTGGPVTPIASSGGGTAGSPGAPGGTPGGPQLTNPGANQALLTAAANQANQAYLMAKLQLDTDELAFRKAQDAFARTIQEAQLTGTYNGAPTLAAQQQQFSQGISAAGLTGYYNGAPTLAREGQQQQTANQYLQLIASLRGPNDPFQYLRTLQGTPQGITDIVNAAAGRYMMGGPASGEISQPASLQGQLNNLNAATGGPSHPPVAGPTALSPGAGQSPGPAPAPPAPAPGAAAQPAPVAAAADPRAAGTFTDVPGAGADYRPSGGDFGTAPTRSTYADAGGSLKAQQGGQVGYWTQDASGQWVFTPETGQAQIQSTSNPYAASGTTDTTAGIGGQLLPYQGMTNPYAAPATTAGNATMQMPNLSGLPQPGQINAANYGMMNPSQQAALWAAYEYGGPSGAMRPADAQFAFAQSLPNKKYVYAPGTTGTIKF